MQNMTEYHLQQESSDISCIKKEKKGNKWIYCLYELTEWRI